MYLSQLVTSLETSQKLKALGVEQESCFVHITFDNESCVDSSNGGYKTMRFTRIIHPYEIEDYEDREHLEWCSAFTSAELGEKMKNKFLDIPMYDSFQSFWRIEHGKMNEWADNEAEARGKLYIYLKENNLV